VITLLTDAAADGRLTMDEHAQRSERALSAKTLGELAGLTSDLTLPSGQPIRLYPRRSVTAAFARERREGRWVVPETFPVTAFFGDVVLDMRNAILASRRTTVFVTAIGGQVKLIVPEGVAVDMAGRSFLGVRSVRGQAISAAAAGQEVAVIEVRTLAVGGAVRAVVARRPRWRPAIRRRAGGRS